MPGWIKLHRKVLENPIFLKPELYQLFSYCLLKANHKDTKIIWNGKEEVLEKGCFLTGRKVIAKDTKQSESSIYRRLKILQKLNMISLKSNNKYSIVKVLNYCIYQGDEVDSEQPANNQRTTNEQPANTDKNDKNVKNDKKDIYALFDVFWKAYPKKKSKEDARKAWKKLKVDDALLTKILSAIDRAKKSKDWLKDNGQFIPHPATWLNGKRWEDDYSQGSESEGKGSEKYGDFYL